MLCGIRSRNRRSVNEALQELRVAACFYVSIHAAQIVLRRDGIVTG